MSQRFEYYITGDDSYGSVYGVHWAAQTFKPSTTHYIVSVKLKLHRVGSPGTLTVSIRNASVEGVPGTIDRATGTTDGNTLTTDTAGEWRTVTFSSSYRIANTLIYAIVIRGLSSDNTNKVFYHRDVSSPTYTDGEVLLSSESGSNWLIQAHDMMFEEWGGRDLTKSASASLGLSPSSSHVKGFPRTASVSLGLSPSVSKVGVYSKSASASMSLESSISTELNIASYLCIASRDSGSVKTGESLGGTWTDCAKDAGGGLPGAYFAQYLNRLCVVNSQHTGFSYSSANDITANWTEKASFPNLPENFTDMFVARDAGDDPVLYFLTPIGMYYLDVFSNFVFGPTELSWEYDSASGKKGLYWKGSSYVSVGKGIYRVTSGTVDLIGPDMDDGLPEDMQGTITDMIGVGFWLVISIDGGSSNKSSILKRYITGKHWHPVYVGSVNTPISALFWDSGTLYFGEGTNVKSLPFSNKTENVAKLSTHTYSASGDIIYPYFHSEFEAMPKVAHKVRAVTEDCDADEKITVSYRKDSETPWTELGSFTSSPRPTALPFPSSGDSIGVSFERIQFKVAYARGSTTTNSPKIKSLILEYRVIPPVLWGFDMRVLAVTSGDKRGQDIIDALRTAIETGTLLSFYPSGDKDKTEYFVEVRGMPGAQMGTEFGAEGIYDLSLEEVID